MNRDSIEFQGLDILHLLSTLTGKPYSNVIPSKEDTTLYMESLIYMMRHNLVVQLHVYLCFKEGTDIVKPSDEVIERIAIQLPYLAPLMRRVGRYFNGKKCLGMICIKIRINDNEIDELLHNEGIVRRDFKVLFKFALFILNLMKSAYRDNIVTMLR